jgi:hypothetical protein
VNKKSLVGFFVISILLFSGCDVLMEECERNNTGTFYIENESSSGRAYKINIDGVNYGVVGAGQTKEWELAASPHVVEILFADTGQTACSVSFPTVIKCEKTGLKCSA